MGIKLNEVTFDICKAHNNMQNKSMKEGTKKQAIAFLKKQANPFEYDIRSCHWDGTTWELSGHVTGDDFLNNPDQLDYVTNHSPANN